MFSLHTICRKSSLHLCIHIAHDAANFIGMEPMDVFVAAEPGHLFAGVDTAILLDFLDGELESTVAIKVGKQLLVAHGIE